MNMQGCESSDLILISDFFCSSLNPIFRLTVLKSTFFQAFRIISDSFRLFLTDAVTLLIHVMNTIPLVGYGIGFSLEHYHIIEIYVTQYLFKGLP